MRLEGTALVHPHGKTPLFDRPSLELPRRPLIAALFVSSVAPGRGLCRHPSLHEVGGVPGALLPLAINQVMAVTQGPIFAKAFDEKVTKSRLVRVMSAILPEQTDWKRSVRSLLQSGERRSQEDAHNEQGRG